MNEIEFIEWLGSEFQNLLMITDQTKRLRACQDLVNKVMNILRELPPNDMAQIKTTLSGAVKTGKIGSFRIPYDIRDDYDWIEGILSTIK